MFAARPAPTRTFTDAPSPTLPLDGPVSKFPHVRSALGALVKQHKPLSELDVEDGSDSGRPSNALLHKVVAILDEEDGDALQSALAQTFGLGADESESHALDLMHAHKNDIAGLPLLFISNPRRPISRPSSRASMRPGSLDTPASQSAPTSPLAAGFRRPPLVSPSGLSHFQPSSYISSNLADSPTSSPTLGHASLGQGFPQFASSLPPSPLASPRLLNAKANEFRPGPISLPRPISRASSYTGSLAALRAQTPSPDLWSTKSSSNLAIAAPLLPEGSLSRLPTPSSSLRSIVRPDEQDHDPFDPFSATPEPLSFPSLDNAEFAAALDATWSSLSNSTTAAAVDDFGVDEPTLPLTPVALHGSGEPEADADAVLTDGMTPFDVLSSVFGATLAPSELEEALAENAYDFERAIAWLIERALPAPPAKTALGQQYVGGRVTVVPRGGAVRGGRGEHVTGRGEHVTGRGSPRFMNGRTPGSGRVCRYFLAGECLRADCRFSHDLERALCRFWLRGTCAKGENCEFLHHLPENVDVSGLTNAMAAGRIDPRTPHEASSPPVDEFPVLGSDAKNTPGAGVSQDPSRTRFAAAVKKAAPTTPNIPTPKDAATLLARRRAMGASAAPLDQLTAIIAPRQSPRLRLRPPTLLPTLPTGGAMNEMYMTYRKRALQLGAARNACLSRAADAWRRGDGAAAKRFSREGHDLNAKMRGEMADAARSLVRERNALVEHAVRTRDYGWSDDPADRSMRGRPCGARLGVVMGVASRTLENGKLTPEERTECLVDLHGLHSNEATEVLEEFLLGLESENFYGLAYLLIGEEKHTGTQDPARGASRHRLATGVRELLHHWSYPWSERDGCICVDALTHAAMATPRA